MNKTGYYYFEAIPTMDGIEKIVDTADEFANGDGLMRLFYLLQSNRLDYDEIDRWANRIARATSALESEYNSFERYSKIHNKIYATEYNDCFGDGKGLMRKLRKHVNRVNSVMRRTCPKNHPTSFECKRYRVAQRSIYDASVLNKDSNYIKDVFGVDEIPDVVKGLYTELLRFFEAQRKCFQLFLDVVNVERKIRKDPQWAKIILDDYRERVLYSLKGLLPIYKEPSNIELLKNSTPLYAEYVKTKPFGVFAAAHFHKEKPEVMNRICLIDFLDNKAEFTPEELLLFHDNIEHIKNVKKVIANIDKLFYDKTAKKIPGQYLFLLCDWICPDSLRKGYRYLESQYEGKLIKYNAVNKYRTSLAIDDPAREDFNNRKNSVIITRKIEKTQPLAIAQ